MLSVDSTAANIHLPMGLLLRETFGMAQLYMNFTLAPRVR